MIDIRKAPQIAMHNKSNLMFVRECVCYYCIKAYFVSEIKDWTDRELDTAICPHCGIDAVLPVHEEKDKDLMNLKKINEYWF
jgi:hypothetical protein